MEELHIARAWREIGPQQTVAVHSLSRAFPEVSLHFHVVSTETPSADALELFKDLLPDRVSFGFFTTEILDDYAKSCGATDSHLKKFSEWRWIYHLILYHALYNEEKLDYVLSYDDDIFFNGELSEAKSLLAQKLPFAIEDMHTDGDKCMFPALIEHFGPEIFDKYYSSPNNHLSSNSGFMGISLKSIFSQFPRGRDFVKMLDMFQYSPYVHGKQSLPWKDYRILLQEQSFLGILNRALNPSHFVLNQAESGYSVKEIATSSVQHYVAERKLSEDFLNRVQEEYQKILKEKNNR